MWLQTFCEDIYYWKQIQRDQVDNFYHGDQFDSFYYGDKIYVFYYGHRVYIV